jgi:putative transposase
MDERYLLAVARYVELNPIRAGLVDNVEQYPWSSASAHIEGRDDQLVKVSPLRSIVGDWQDFLSEGVSAQEVVKLRRHERTGRPLGTDGFIARLEKTLNRLLQKQKLGPKPKKGNN